MGETRERQIQSGGRVTIPKDWREEYGLKRGTSVRMRLVDGKIEIEVPARLSSLYGLIETEEPCDRPKRKARAYAKENLKGKLQEDRG